MPISNLSIQRRRLNELKRLGYKAEPTEFDNYTRFCFPAVEVNGIICGRLNQAGFHIEDIYGDKMGLFITVTKKPEEKERPIIRKQLAETLK